MKPLRVVICQGDNAGAHVLASSFAPHAHSVHVASSPENLRETILKARADVLVLDMEIVPLEEMNRIHREFSDLCIIGIHRLADEEIWAAALNSGASDVCDSSDSASILRSVLNATALTRGTAA